MALCLGSLWNENSCHTAICTYFNNRGFTRHAVCGAFVLLVILVVPKMPPQMIKRKRRKRKPPLLQVGIHSTSSVGFLSVNELGQYVFLGISLCLLKIFSWINCLDGEELFYTACQHILVNIFAISLLCWKSFLCVCQLQIFCIWLCFLVFTSHFCVWLLSAFVILNAALF